MATVKRRTVNSYMQQAQLYLFHRYEAATAEKPRDRAKKWLKDFIQQNGKIADNGNVVSAFDKPMVIGNTTHYGLELRKIPGAESFDPEEVKVFLLKKKLDIEDYEQVFYTVRIDKFDQDALYVLQQEGKITEKELRKLVHTNNPTYQLWPLDQPVDDDDD